MPDECPGTAHGAIDEQALGGPPDPQCRRVAEPGACQLLDLQRKVRVRQDVDIDGRNAAADNTDATVGPARPCRNLDSVVGRSA
ncbi:MAG: hypothetical protein IPF48_05750 [Sphingomonadales bacterium]|nr:hypothetical protein [Sphingomonadales bacterium]